MQILEFAKTEAYQVLLTILVCILILLNYLMTSVLVILLQEYGVTILVSVAKKYQVHVLYSQDIC